jgi:hypothetical protein
MDADAILTSQRETGDGVSQLSRPFAFAYPNQRVIRPPLSREHRNRVFVAGAVSNTVLSVGLTSVSLAGILILIGAALSLVWWWMAHALRRAA